MVSRSRSERGLRAALAAAVLGGALVGALLGLAVGESARRSMFDFWQRLAPREVSAEGVAVVLIDPLSLQTLGPWPWPRYYMARLVEEIAAQGPRAIGLDMIFAEPDRLNPENFAELYPELGRSGAIAWEELPTMDALFAEALAQAPVVLARLGIAADGSDPAHLMVEPLVGGRPPAQSLAFPQVLASISGIDDVALGHGMINGPPDEDGVVRRVPLTVLAKGRSLPGFAVEMARQVAGAPALEWEGRRLRVGETLLPADDSGSLALRFGRFPDRAIYSAARVLAEGEGGVPPNAFAGKAVLVGLAAEGTADIVATPLETEGYGVLVQAEAVDAILNGGWLDRPPWLAAVEWAAGALLAVLLLLAGLRRVRWPVAAAAVGAGALVAASWIAFDRGNLLFDPLRPLMLGLGAATALAVVQFARVRAERARLADALVEQRVAGAVQEGELQAARRIQLGMVPSERKLAALDPRTEIAAVLKPARLVGGDFFEALRLDADRLLFVVGDVTGKGVPAALYMALSKTLAKSAFVRHRGGLAGTVAEINDELLREADEDMGVTMLIVLLDASSGELAMVNAGHENPIVVRGDGSAETLSLVGGPPFCVCDFPYPEEHASLAHGETLVMISDGVTEAQDRAGALFGLGRTVAVLSECGRRSVSEQVDGLCGAVAEFQRGKDASDDVTILAIRYLGGETAQPHSGRLLPATAS